MPPRALRLRAVSLAACLAVTAAGPAFADEDHDRRAAQEFDEGQRAFAGKDYVRAAESFEAAYRDKPHHAPLWNAARSWDRAGEDVRAANLYARYLAEAPPDAPDRDQATAALRALSARVGRVEIHAADVSNVRLDGRAASGPTIYVAPGEHVLEGDASSGLARKTFHVDAGKTESVSLTPPPKPASETQPIPPPTPHEEASRKPLPPIVVYVGGALTLVATGLTIASGFDTVSKKHAFLDDETQPRLDDAFSSQTRTNVALGATIGLGVITGAIALFFADWSGGAPATPPRTGSR